MMQSINTILVNMPGTISAYTISNVDMSYTIVLNARLTRERLLEAYLHEVNHIENGDYDKRGSVDSIEHDAHKNK